MAKKKNKKKKNKKQQQGTSPAVESAVDTTLATDRARGEEFLDYLRGQGLLDIQPFGDSPDFKIPPADTTLNMKPVARRGPALSDTNLPRSEAEIELAVPAPRVTTDFSKLSGSIAKAEDNYLKTLQRNEEVKNALRIMRDNMAFSGAETQALREQGRRELDSGYQTARRAIRTSGGTGSAQAAAASYLGRDYMRGQRAAESDLMALQAREAGARQQAYAGTALAADQADRMAQATAMRNLLDSSSTLSSLLLNQGQANATNQLTAAAEETRRQQTAVEQDKANIAAARGEKDLGLESYKAQTDQEKISSDAEAAAANERYKLFYNKFLADQANAANAIKIRGLDIGQDEKAKAAAIQALIGGMGTSAAGRTLEENRRDTRKLTSIANRGY